MPGVIEVNGDIAPAAFPISRLLASTESRPVPPLATEVTGLLRGDVNVWEFIDSKDQTPAMVGWLWELIIAGCPLSLVTRSLAPAFTSIE